MQKESCSRSCGRQCTPKSNLHRPICDICQAEIDTGKVVWRDGFLVDLPDEIRRYDKYGEVKVAVYLTKGRPRHTHPSDAPEITWKQFVEHLLFNNDFYGSWSLWIFKRPDARGDGAQICMDANCGPSADHVYVRIKDGRPL